MKQQSPPVTIIFILILFSLLAGCTHLSKDKQAQATLQQTYSPELTNISQGVNRNSFGPLLGANIIQKTPVSGKYFGSYTYFQETFLTMEEYTSTTIDGQARIELLPNGTSTVCTSWKNERNSSISKYASMDKKYHYDTNIDSRTLGMSGTWLISDGILKLTLTQKKENSCSAQDTATHLESPVLLNCIAIEQNKVLPMDILACSIQEDDRFFRNLAVVNPEDSPRAGPFMLQQVPGEPLLPEKGKAWLLLGSSPGLHIQAKEGRRDSQSTVQFSKDLRSQGERNRFFQP